MVIAATAVDPQGLSLDQLERKLSDAGVAVDVRRELRAVLEAAEQARFSGGGGGDADLQSRASALISRLVEPRA